MHPALLRVRVTARAGAGVAGVGVDKVGRSRRSDDSHERDRRGRLRHHPMAFGISSRRAARLRYFHSPGTVEFTATAEPSPIALLRLDRSLAMLRSYDALQFRLSRAEDVFGNSIPTPGLAIAWSSDAPAVADVSPNGLLSAHTCGEA